MKKVIFLFLVFTFFITLISAEVEFGYKVITIESKITNMADFLDYYLFSVCFIDSPQEMVLIPDSGIIPESYNSCVLNIYAVDKDSFRKELLKRGDRYLVDFSQKDYTEHIFALSNYIKNPEVIKLAEGLKTHKTILVANPLEGMKYYYTLTLDGIKTSPDVIKRSFSINYFIGIIVTISFILLFYTLYRTRN